MDFLKTSTTELRSAAEAWLRKFDDALQRRDFVSAGALFAPGGYWRDLLAFTWDLRTFKGPDEVREGLAETHDSCRASSFLLEDQAPFVGELGQFGQMLQVFYTFKTRLATGRGFMRLIPGEGVNDGLKAFTFLTTIKELDGVPEEPRVRRRRESTWKAGTENWLDRRIAESEFRDSDPEVLIIGAGQAGLTLAAHLRQLDVSTLVVDKMERVGDNWRKRYHSLVLHNEICSNQLPYMPFPEQWPVYLPKDMLAHWLESYVVSMELNVWLQTTFETADYDPDVKRWTVQLRRADGSVRTMRPSHFVLAIGVSGTPNVPAIPHQEDFKGVVRHSSQSTADFDAKGRKALVVGTGTSAHDIAQDLHVRGADVTIVQRSPTTVVGLETSSLAIGLYVKNEGVRPIGETDLMVAGTPFDLVRQLHGPLSHKMQECDRELLEGLRKAGFLLDNGYDDTGFFLKLLRTLGGYYLNVGASDLIVEGKIKVKSGVGMGSFTPHGVRFTDGTEKDADLVVMATGYKPVQDVIRSMFGGDVAERVGPIWGLGTDGELRGMWSRTGQERFYVVGGTITMCRFYSRYTALLIKATLLGLIAEGGREPAPPPKEGAPLTKHASLQ
jgi:cation diffusion facilitator CzcD-associated flavoprotein CzcO